MGIRYLGRVWIICIILSGTAWGDEAARFFSDGNNALRDGKLPQALQCYGEASRLDRDNQSYRDQYLLVRRVIKIRNLIEKEKDAEKWLGMALSLRGFYYDNHIHAEALALDRRIHATVGTADSATMLAESLLAVGENKDAVELLSGIGEKTPETEVFLGLGLARLGMEQKAGEIAERLAADRHSPQVEYHLARICALLGNVEGAAQALKSCFEQVPPSQLEAIKAQARECKDFTVAAASPDFAEVFATRSQVKESRCSSGSDCSRCPGRSSCGDKNK